MRRTVLLLVAMGFIFGLVACVAAERRPHVGDSYGPYDRADRHDISTRIENQQRRIERGISSGDLTRREADVLIDNLNWIKDEHARAKRDGRLSPSEVERLSEHLDQNSRMITDKRKNEIRRVYTPVPPPPPPAHVPAPRHEQPRGEFHDRLESQQKRIDQGVAKGDLTRREADMLQENLSHIREEYRKMKADGRLTRKEADRLERDFDVNDRMIQDKRTNEIRRLYESPSRPAAGDEQLRSDLRDLRMENQLKRIDERAAKGELTWREAEIVRKNLDRIKDAYARLKAEGRVTEKELKILDKKLDRNDKMIHEKKHNPIERFD